ncbi:MAG: oxygenase MpaB family protein [Sphingomonadales bacterium]
METTASPNPSQEIESLDAREDYARIAFLLSYQLFPLTIEKALEYALFKTYASPRISKLLAATGEFTKRPQKRYDDTVLVLAEITENGHDSGRGQASYARLNAMQGRFNINNDDFLYTLGTFIFEPIRALKLYGPRPMTPHEEDAWFQSYLRLGRGMGIQDLPTVLQAFHTWYKAYEKEHFRLAKTNRIVADSTVEVLFDMLRVPSVLRPFSHRVLVALMEPHVAKAFGYDAPSKPLRAAVSAMMRLRRTIAALLPENTSLRLQTQRRLRSYPNGYLIERLGTFAATPP